MQSYEKNVREVLTTIRAQNQEADIYLMGLYNPFDKWFSNIKEFDEILLEWNRTSEEIAKSFDNVHLVKISSLFENDKENLIYEEDYFHPNSKGYQLMGNAVYEELKKYTISPTEQQENKEN